MSKTSTRYTLAATAIAVASLLSACGGGGTTPGTSENTSAVSGDTGTCTAAPCINFAESTAGLVNFGDLGAEITADPADASNKAAKLTKTTGSQTWAGATVHLGTSDYTVTAIDPAQAVTLRVYAPAAGKTVMVKIENADGSVFKEAQATTTKAGEWETLSFDFSAADANASYVKVSVFPGFNTQLDEVYYIDELKYTAKQSGGSSSASTLAFSTGFASAVLTAEGGLVATAGGSGQDGWNCSGDAAWCGSFSGGTGADSYAGFYYQTPAAITDGIYSQIEVFGPGITGLSNTADTGGVTITNQTKVNFTFNQNAEWYNGSNNKFGVVITLGKRYAIDGGCHIQLHGVKTPTSVDATAYSMTLASDFRVASNCGTDIAPTDVAAALAASPVVSSVKFLGAGGTAAIIGANSVTSGANLNTAADGVYPTTVVLKGGITFN